ncbi:LysR family transcriptional regulator, transcriptional activator of nhaA [Allopseudospirillum japonicum]|uniref:LysR family transcriptional regulator, transcriptional activator of nhaA n=1 Tax=Allopseudospirillum japonicum TaxID=64971 RepID=A0A1H6U469_9GAMM|nr:LysR substrate-binding domain-containing protein [Allopseudospirillum japonicum]SEI83185.1 LysR family transcriptional regulator, transcriptional activator of nhaA [Allopseudospirillum japonicum]
MRKDFNLKHLYYFWVIAQAGSIAQASDQLDLAPQTLSGQLSSFEAYTGALFARKGRGLVLTPLGQAVKAYADQIFTLTGELDQLLQQPSGQVPLKFSVGISASVHKINAYHLLAPALALDRPLNLTSVTGYLPNLLRDLRRQMLDVVISDQAQTADLGQDLYRFLLSSSPLTLFAAPELATKLAPHFPHSLDGQPLLIQGANSAYVHQLQDWLKQQHIQMQIYAEINDSALIKVFGRKGKGIFAAPTNIQHEVCRQYVVRPLGEVSTVKVEHFAICRTPRPIHLGIQGILQNAPLAHL